jgi:hypothetical protein
VLMRDRSMVKHGNVDWGFKRAKASQVHSTEPLQCCFIIDGDDVYDGVAICLEDDESNQVSISDESSTYLIMLMVTRSLQLVVVETRA